MSLFIAGKNRRYDFIMFRNRAGSSRVLHAALVRVTLGLAFHTTKELLRFHDSVFPYPFTSHKAEDMSIGLRLGGLTAPRCVQTTSKDHFLFKMLQHLICATFLVQKGF